MPLSGRHAMAGRPEGSAERPGRVIVGGGITAMTIGTRGHAVSAVLDIHARGARPGTMASPRSPFADPGRLLAQTLDAIEDGVVVTDDRAIILHANRAARTIFATGLLTQKNGILCAGTPQATRALQAAIAGQDGAGIPMVLGFGLPCERQIATVTVSLGPDPAYGQAGPVVVVTIRGTGRVPLPSADTLQAAFDLTPAEAKTAREVLRGDGVTACARRLGVTANTARTHLNRVFDKTGTKRQAELVRLLLGYRG